MKTGLIAPAHPAGQASDFFRSIILPGHSHSAHWPERIFSKGNILLPAALIAIAASSFAQETLQTDLQVLDRGPHHKTIQAVSLIRDESGSLANVTNNYVQIESGISYQDAAGQWRDAVPQFVAFQRGAVSQQTLLKIILAANPNAADAVDLLMPDGQRLVCHVLGLSYFDAASGKSVMLAPIKDAQGELLLPDKNQVLFSDAFADTKAGLIYVLTKALGFTIRKTDNGRQIAVSLCQNRCSQSNCATS